MQLFLHFLLLLLALSNAFQAIRGNHALPNLSSLSSSRLCSNHEERTYIMVKPDGVQRRVVGDIISRFERRGFLLRALKFTRPTRSQLEEHYRELKDKPFFANIVNFMASGPVVAMVWEGKNAVRLGRAMLGATDPSQSALGTIRGDFGLTTGRNICHGSDSVESAEREIALWFNEGVCDYDDHSHDWINE